MGILKKNEELNISSRVITGSKYILESLKEKGIQHIFMLPGKMVQPFMEDMTNMRGIHPVVVTHEASAGYMADAYARVTQGVGVALSISSPGAMNLLPAVASAWADGVPILALSGDVATHHEAKGAFQDGSALGTNDVAVYQTVTGLASRVNHAERIPDYLAKAFERMALPNKLPAFIQLPLDVQKAKLDPKARPLETHQYPISANPQLVKMVADKLAQPDARNLILLGPEARNSRCAQVVIQLAEKLDIPVAVTLDAKGTFPEDHKMYLGVFGFAGHQRAMEALLSDAFDHVVTFGVNFDQRSSLCWSDQLAKSAQWFCCSAKLGQYYLPLDSRKIHASPDEFLDQLWVRVQSEKVYSSCAHISWLNTLFTVPLHVQCDEFSSEYGIHPKEAICQLRLHAPRSSIVSVDSGSHRVFCAHYWQSYEPNQYLTSASTAPMGWAICAGVAAKLAQPEYTSIVITGDGCMLMHGNEIQTAARYDIPVVFVVLNNSAHGGIHVETQKHQSFMPELTKLPQHDWKKYAESLGLTAYRVSDPDLLPSVYQQALDSHRPCLIDVICRDDVCVPNTYYAKNNNNLL
ncbi:thiamine pyrophosphate-binding protein [Vibrio sp. Isolate23]|uniref:thiamine pyrophosphate-binding protein n=1 Tax=Vibrio sp. Isolate23 TaxID=2908533 RepID=UPI0023D8FE61|nr:thiamine pyrophosphate-binding protein [Vibrio sp. Isolate23]